jgi:predicted enzyme related to lactoylglutathione lyase
MRPRPLRVEPDRRFRGYPLTRPIQSFYSGVNAMHRSRLGQVIIDCQAGDLTEAARFWSQALGRAIGPAEKPASEKYVTLGSGKEDFLVLLQMVDHPSRVHLDIEADDVEREAERLEKLGAKRIERIKKLVGAGGADRPPEVTAAEPPQTPTLPPRDSAHDLRS